jgi:hypothetical protein
MCIVNEPVASAEGIFSPLEPSLVIVSANMSITVTSPTYMFKNGCCYNTKILPMLTMK